MNQITNEEIFNLLLEIQKSNACIQETLVELRKEMNGMHEEIASMHEEITGMHSEISGLRD